MKFFVISLIVAVTITTFASAAPTPAKHGGLKSNKDKVEDCFCQSPRCELKFQKQLKKCACPEECKCKHCYESKEAKKEK